MVEVIQIEMNVVLVTLTGYDFQDTFETWQITETSVSLWKRTTFRDMVSQILTRWQQQSQKYFILPGIVEWEKEVNSCLRTMYMRSVIWMTDQQYQHVKNSQRTLHMSVLYRYLWNDIRSSIAICKLYTWVVSFGWLAHSFVHFLCTKYVTLSWSLDIAYHC